MLDLPPRTVRARGLDRFRGVWISGEAIGGAAITSGAFAPFRPLLADVEGSDIA